jgi:hypothetical protein
MAASVNKSVKENLYLSKLTKSNKMKKTLILAAIFFSLAANAQQYLAKVGKAHFFSATSMENIEATSNVAVCFLNTTTKTVSVRIKNKSFKFKDGLMQDHFNENYMESDKYEYSKLDGAIVENIDFTKDGTYDVSVKGTVDIHGVKLDREIKAKLIIKNGVPVNATAKFDVKLGDHKIKIPSLLGANIAENITVDVDFNFEKYEKK